MIGKREERVSRGRLRLLGGGCENAQEVLARLRRNPRAELTCGGFPAPRKGWAPVPLLLSAIGWEQPRQRAALARRLPWICSGGSLRQPAS